MLRVEVNVYFGYTKNMLLKRTMRGKPINIYTGKVNAYIFYFIYIVYYNKLVIRTECSVHTAEINNDKLKPFFKKRHL